MRKRDLNSKFTLAALLNLNVTKTATKIQKSEKMLWGGELGH